MKILITGGSGLLGQYIIAELSDTHEILSLYHSNPGNSVVQKSARADITDWNTIKKIFTGFSPDVVIHTAAISRPEKCDELPKEYVRKVNIESSENLSGLCSDLGCGLIFTSTDLVYNGDAGGMIAENGPIDPRSYYAESKVYAEEKIVASGCRHLILRTSLMYGFGSNPQSNNFHNIYDNLKNRKQVNLFYDQFRTPIALHDAARLIRNLAEMDLESATLNFGGRERVSRLELGQRLCEAAGFDRKHINSVSMFDVSTVHKVRDVSLDTGKLSSMGLEQKSIDDSINEILNNSEAEE